jgi:endo-1,4-beta-mannosidase
MVRLTPAIAAILLFGGAGMAEMVLGVDQTHFTLNGKPTFLYGISYYGALGASDEAVRADLDDMQRHGLNWIRVWATWSAFDHDVSAVDADGNARAEFLARLKALVADCDARGMVVDVTLSRGDKAAGPPRLGTHDAHARAVETIVTELKPFRNWYLDLSNERNVRDARYTSFEDLRDLRELVRRLDPDRLVTASQGGDIDADELRRYVQEMSVDFITPHRPRDAESPGQTEAKTREYLAQMATLGRVVPVHYQEPFRRDYGAWQPTAQDFLADYGGALAGGAAGWCLHNGSSRSADDGRPRRSFDLRDGRLFEQLDEQERQALALIRP